MTERTIWRDGEFVPWQDAAVHVLSHSVQRGSLAFDYLSVHRTRNGVAMFRLRDHLERLLRTCRLVGLPLTYGVEELTTACAETVRRNPGAKSVKISAMIPSIEVELIPQDPRVAVFIAAYDGDADIIAKNEGEFRRRSELSLTVERGSVPRHDDALPPQAKVAANYTAAMSAKWQARRRGFDDILLLDAEGWLTEAPTANVFVVNADGSLATPPAAKVLLGITRDSVIALAKAAGIRCEERDIAAEELGAASEVFLSGTSVGVWPVVRIDGQAVADGRVGATTSRLRERYFAAARGEDAAFEHWLHYV